MSPALPMELTRPCPGGNQGQNVRGWCAPAWEHVDGVVDTPAGRQPVAYLRLICKFCGHVFPRWPAAWVPPEQMRWPQGGGGSGGGHGGRGDRGAGAGVANGQKK